MDYLMDLKFTSEYWALAFVMLLCICDVATGYVGAWIRKEIRSSRMREGLGKKFGELVYVLIAVVTKYAFSTNLIFLPTISYVCIMELVSLAENIDKLGVKLPKCVREKINNIIDKKEDQ